jgi:hypothetical protein
MKKVLLTISSICIAATISTAAQADVHISSAFEKQLVNVCHALKSDNRLQLRRAIKRSGVSYKGIAGGLKCNGETAVNFALSNGASQTADLLAKRARWNADGMLAKN